VCFYFLPLVDDHEVPYLTKSGKTRKKKGWRKKEKKTGDLLKKRSSYGKIMVQTRHISRDPKQIK
jgi:hypothetical protein